MSLDRNTDFIKSLRTFCPKTEDKMKRKESVNSKKRE